MKGHASVVSRRLSESCVLVVILVDKSSNEKYNKKYKQREVSNAIPVYCEGKKDNGEKEEVEAIMEGVEPEATQKLVVEVNRRLYPVKQVFSYAFDVDRADFISHQARNVMQRLGFKVKRLV